MLLLVPVPPTILDIEFKISTVFTKLTSNGEAFPNLSSKMTPSHGVTFTIGPHCLAVKSDVSIFEGPVLENHWVKVIVTAQQSAFVCLHTREKKVQLYGCVLR